MQQYDVVIVGGGPAGLSAALLLSRCCRQVVVIDSGHPRNAAARELHGFLGRDGTKPEALRAAGRDELQRYGTNIIDDEVTAATCQPAAAGESRHSAFIIETKGGHRFVARKLLLATGVCDELPALGGLQECYGISVHHCPYCDAWEHRDKRLCAYAQSFGAAASLGLALRTWSSHVTVLTDGDHANPADQERLQANGIALMERAIVRLVHTDGRLSRIECEGGKVVPADALFFESKQRPSCGLARTLGCELDEKSRTHSEHKQHTNVPGVFVAGDVDGDVQFAIVAAAEGAIAATAINRELQKDDRA